MGENFYCSFNRKQTKRLGEIAEELGDRSIPYVLSTAMSLLSICVREEKKGNDIGFYDPKTMEIKKLVIGITKH